MKKLPENRELRLSINLFMGANVKNGNVGNAVPGVPSGAMRKHCTRKPHLFSGLRQPERRGRRSLRVLK